MSNLKRGRAPIKDLFILALILCLLGATPGATFAAPISQTGELDPDVRQAIQNAASQVDQRLGAFAPTVTTAEPPEEPQLPNTELVEYEEQGVTISVPADWEVTPGSGDTVFEISEEISGLKGMVAATGNAFPGLIALPMFEVLADMLVQTMGPDAELVDVARLASAQGLPVLRIAFTGATEDDFAGDGVIYIVGTGDNAYGVIVGAPSEAWPDMEPAIADLVDKLVIDPELISLQRASDGELMVDDPGERFTLTIPEGWNVTSTSDEDLSLLIADPEIRFVGAVTARADLAENDEGLQALIEATAGALDEQTANELIGGVLEALDLGSDTMILDETLTDIFPLVNESLGVIRLGGAFEVDDGVEMPVVSYLAVYPDAVSLIILFGAPDDVLAEEEALLGILGSLEFVE